MNSQRRQTNEEGKSVWDNRKYSENKKDKDTSGAIKDSSTIFKIGRISVKIDRYSTGLEILSARAPNKQAIFLSRQIQSFEEILICEETKKKNKELWEKSFERNDEYNFTSPEESEEEEWTFGE